MLEFLNIILYLIFQCGRGIHNFLNVYLVYCLCLSLNEFLDVLWWSTYDVHLAVRIFSFVKIHTPGLIAAALSDMFIIFFCHVLLSLIFFPSFIALLAISLWFHCISYWFPYRIIECIVIILFSLLDFIRYKAFCDSPPPPAPLYIHLKKYFLALIS